MALDAWGRLEDDDGGRKKRLAASYFAAALVVTAVLALGVAFGGQIKKQVFEEEVDVKFVPPEPVKAAPPPPPPPPPPPKAVPQQRAALGAKRDPVPTELPKGLPEEGDPNRAKGETPFGEGDPNGCAGCTGKGGGVIAPKPVETAPPAPPPPPMQIAEVSTAPQPILKAMPAYPEDARRQGIEAIVVVKFVVNEDGHVEEIKVVKGHPLFDAIVLAAVRTWTFSPATLEGKPVRMARMVKIPFRLKHS